MTQHNISLFIFLMAFYVCWTTEFFFQLLFMIISHDYNLFRDKLKVGISITRIQYKLNDIICWYSHDFNLMSCLVALFEWFIIWITLILYK